MIRILFGSGALGGGFSARKMAGYLERSGFWAGARPPRPGDDARTAIDGLIAGTLIATETGWQRAEDLRPGDRIVTFDNGLVPLREVTRSKLMALEPGPERGVLPRSALPLAVPAGALGNRRDMVLLPEQAVLIETDQGEVLYGDPFTLIPATALDGFRDISRRAAQGDYSVVFLEFEGDEIVYAEGMVLLHCPRRQPVMVVTPDDLIRSGSAHHYPLLPPAQSQALIASLPAQ